ncbi:putative 2-oxoglutarate/Fe(II)-dependent dioxygenase [Hibiscus syriacus]|uniref:2-oxoglutarate/Fe(II)-dependent dioxygenase n=1 Tax=Hibiscus syriacus TaxID=106335 RepID=A0A6A3CXJ9_HIBSY|nr:protein SRG1-like [Hibiscus syriacus]KAE8734305.1 putative 2-oxoglutarate/Fe(II)-dependent dioxygenase [Hibiscus syriacus]
MEEEQVNLGSSILVPCVQEVAEGALNQIPRRYQRPDQDPIETPSMPQQVPVIDLQKLLSGDSMDVELEKLHHACKHWGFFQLRNHGVSSSLVEKVKKGIEGLFKLPMEEKRKLWQRPGELEGFGQAFVVSEEQKLDWGDIFFIASLPTHLRKPHLFQNLPLPFRDDIEAYSVEVNNLALKILGFQAKALRMDPEDMKIFKGGYQTFRINYYPPCPQPELAIGLTPHTDGVGITILLQINETEGLQIKKDGAWILIKPLPDALVVNVGDIMEIITNGTYPSIEHRAVVNSDKERLSVATFLCPRLEAQMGPAQSLITSQTPPQFKTLVVSDYLKGLFKRKLEGKSYLDDLRIEN